MSNQESIVEDVERYLAQTRQRAFVVELRDGYGERRVTCRYFGVVGPMVIFIDHDEEETFPASEIVTPDGYGAPVLPDLDDDEEADTRQVAAFPVDVILSIVAVEG